MTAFDKKINTHTARHCLIGILINSPVHIFYYRDRAIVIEKAQNVDEVG
jgi:hypothetical protein